MGQCIGFKRHCKDLLWVSFLAAASSSRYDNVIPCVHMFVCPHTIFCFFPPEFVLKDMCRVHGAKGWRVQSAVWGWSTECIGKCVAYWVKNVKYRLQSALCRMWNVLCTLRCAYCSLKSAVCILQKNVLCSVQIVVCWVKYAVCKMHHAQYTVQIALRRMHCAKYKEVR